jgi:hypothetical protein
MAIQTQVVIYDAANHKHVILASGDKLDKSILDLTAGAASFNPGTGDLSLTFADGSNIVVNLGTLAADKFLSGSSYNSATHELILNMSDGSTYTVPLNDLIPVQVDNTPTTTASGDGTSTAPITIDVKISADPDNQLSVAPDGLFVPPVDLTAAPAPTPADNGTVTTQSISNTGGVADVLLGDPAGWATISIGGVAKRIPYWD